MGDVQANVPTGIQMVNHSVNQLPRSSQGCPNFIWSVGKREFPGNESNTDDPTLQQGYLEESRDHDGMAKERQSNDISTDASR